MKNYELNKTLEHLTVTCLIFLITLFLGLNSFGQICLLDQPFKYTFSPSQQSISSNVISQNDSKPIPFVNIQVFEQEYLITGGRSGFRWGI